jgi:hypothetical protein
MDPCCSLDEFLGWAFTIPTQTVELNGWTNLRHTSPQLRSTNTGLFA